MTGHAYDRPVPPRRHPSQIADARAWAERIRQAGTFGTGHCGDPADVHDSEFRRWARLGPVHHCRLREIARRQAAETRLARTAAPA